MREKIVSTAQETRMNNVSQYGQCLKEVAVEHWTVPGTTLWFNRNDDW
jgi:hypothetical protein